MLKFFHMGDASAKTIIGLGHSARSSLNLKPIELQVFFSAAT